MAENKAVIITEEDKEILLQRYSDIEWSDDVTDLRCVRCQRVAIHHYMSNCKHLFCRNCKRVFSDGGRWKCPKCREYVTKVDDQDMNIEYKLGQMQVFCLNKKYGCQHVHQLRIIAKHMEYCENTREAALPMEYKGTNTLDYVYRYVSGLSEQLRELRDEMRVMRSENEANWMEMTAKMNEMKHREENMIDAYEAQLKDVHNIIATMNTEKETDKRAMTQLDNKITTLSNDVQKQNEHLNAMDQHGKDERNREMEQLEAIREVMKKSEASIRAELTAMDAIVKECKEQVDEMRQKNDVELVQQKMEEMKEQMLNHGDEIRLKMSLTEAEMRAVAALPVVLNQIAQVNTDVFEWNIKINEIDNLLTERTTDVLRLPGYPFGLQAKLTPLTSETMGVYHRLIDVYDTRRLTTQSMPKIIYVIPDENVHSWHRKNDVIRYCDYEFVQKLEYDDYIGPWLIVDFSKPLYAQYKKKSFIKIKILVEPPSMANSFASNEGVLYWKVDNYRKRKRMEEESLITSNESPYFYTAPQGYRVGALISLKTMNVWIEARKGKYDDKLTRHLKHMITITLFNQTDPSTNLIKSHVLNISNFNKNRSLKLCQSSDVEQNGFVKNDSILLKIVVESLKD